MLVQLHRMRTTWERYAPLLVFLAIALAVILLAPRIGLATAGEGDSDLTPVGPDSQTTDTALFSLSPFLVAVILGSLVPVLNGILTKLSTSSKVKVVFNMVLSAIVGLVTVSIVDGGGAVFSQSAVISAILAFWASITSYAGLWRPLEITSSPVAVTNEAGQRVEKPGKLATVGVS